MDKKRLFLCPDSGLYTAMASALAEEGKNDVIYVLPNVNAFPMLKDIVAGLNMGMMKLDKYGLPLQFWDYVDKADCIVNFDVSQNDVIAFLREKYPDKSIVGAGKAAVLEDNRVVFKRVLKAAGLSVGGYEVKHGFSELVDYLKDKENVYIKISIFRGSWETMHFETWDKSRQILYKRATQIGLDLAETIDFMVEEPLESIVEIGVDGFFCKDHYIPFSMGWEIAKNAYFGRTGSQLCPQIEETLDALTPFWTKAGYAGLLSTEEKIMSATEHYFIDCCSRGALPLGVLYPRYIGNWSDFIYHLGKGEDIGIEYESKKYVGAFCLSSDDAKEDDLLMSIKKGHEKDFAFMMAYKDGKGQVYSVKGNTGIVVVMADGDSPEDVVKGLKDKIKYVSAHGLDDDPINSIDKIHEIIKEGESCGISF